MQESKVIPLNEAVTPEDLEAISAILNKDKMTDLVQRRSGTTIGTNIPRVPGKGSNRDLSKFGRL